MKPMQIAYLKVRAKLMGVYLFRVPRTVVITLCPVKPNLLSTYIQPLGDWATPAWFHVVGVDSDDLYLHAMPQSFSPPQHLTTNTYFDYGYLMEVGS